MIKPYLERVPEGGGLGTHIEAMQDEINELRAELARVKAKWRDDYELLDDVCRQVNKQEAELAALKKQEPVAHVEIGHMVGVRFHEACDYGCGLKDGDMLYLAAGAQPVTLTETLASIGIKLPAEFANKEKQ